MTTKPIRLSPSGPVIGNADGGPFGPGPGARNRLVQDQVLVEADIPLTPGEIGSTIGGTDLRLSLSLPNPALQYRAKIVADVHNPSTTTGVVRLYLDTSTDGAAWTNAVDNQHYVMGAAQEQSGARQVELEMILQPGAAIGVTSSPQSPTLYVRARIGGTSQSGGFLQLYSAGPDANAAGSCTLELEETL